LLGFASVSFARENFFSQLQLKLAIIKARDVLLSCNAVQKSNETVFILLLLLFSVYHFSSYFLRYALNFYMVSEQKFFHLWSSKQIPDHYKHQICSLSID